MVRKGLLLAIWTPILSTVMLKKRSIIVVGKTNVRAIFRDPLIRSTFFPHILILLFIQKELFYANLTSIGFLQEQSSLKKRERSLYYARASEITVQYSKENYNSSYPAYLTNVKS